MSRSIYQAPPGPLPRRQVEVLALIDARLSKSRPFPSLREIADAMGWKNEASAADCLNRLVWRGKLSRSSSYPHHWIKIDPQVVQQVEETTAA